MFIAYSIFGLLRNPATVTECFEDSLCKKNVVYTGVDAFIWISCTAMILAIVITTKGVWENLQNQTTTPHNYKESKKEANDKSP